jgi:hypothetical protein
MTAAPFAQLEARVGRAISARLANGRLVPEGGVAVPVVFSRPAIVASIGQAGMQSREVQASVLTEHLTEDVQRGTRVAVFHDDQMALLAGEYFVRHRDDDLETGMARLDLELAAA